jgi:hypothetical protein
VFQGVFFSGLRAYPNGRTGGGRKSVNELTTSGFGGMPKDVAEERRTKREKSDSRRPYQLFISKPAFLRAIKSTSRVSECINSKLIKQTWKHEKLTVAEAGRELSTGTLRAALLIVKANFVIGFDEKCNDIDAPQPTWQSREGIVTGKLTHHCGREWRFRETFSDSCRYLAISALDSHV